MSDMKKKRNSKRSTFASVVAIILALLMILPLLFTVLANMSPAEAVTQDEIDDLIAESGDLKEQREALAVELEGIKGDKAKAVRQKELLDGEMNLLQAEINNTQLTIETFDALIVQKEIELADAIVAEEEQFELFCRRVRAMEEEGSVSYLSILFGAKDFSDLLDKINIVNDVVAYDNAVAETLEQMRLEIEDAKTALQEYRDEQQAQKELLEEQKVTLSAKIDEAAKLVQEIRDKEAEYEAAIAEFKAAEEAVAKEIDKKQRELAAQNITFDPGTGYLWPLSGYYRLTSLFGPRTHPITGKYHSHGGIDIPAPRGTPIVAARGGVVLLARYNSSYGNYVSISHGSDQSTLYAHMVNYCVSEGDVVTQGQVIGYVGSTGSSTGNHLHYEVRINGARQNAVKYHPNLNGIIYYSYGGYTSYDWSYLTQN